VVRGQLDPEGSAGPTRWWIWPGLHWLTATCPPPVGCDPRSASSSPPRPCSTAMTVARHPPTRRPAAPGLTSEERARREGVASKAPGPARAERAQTGTAWLHGYGTIPPATARPLVCDSDLWRIVLDPTTGMPLDVGDAHRLVPWWIRRALHARDRGCRWPGCPTPAAWTDAHHLKAWRHHHITRVEDLLSLCRYHHVRVHEGGWRIHLDPATGQVHVTRPDASPYEIGPSHPWTTPTIRTDDPTDRPEAA
jgi:hypothetical protein